MRPRRNGRRRKKRMEFEVKYTHPKSGKTIDVAEQSILDYIRRSGAFRARVAKLLASIGGSKGGKRSLETMTPEARRARACKAVAAREEKRAAKCAKSVQSNQ